MAGTSHISAMYDEKTAHLLIVLQHIHKILNAGWSHHQAAPPRKKRRTSAFPSNALVLLFSSVNYYVIILTPFDFVVLLRDILAPFDFCCLITWYSRALWFLLIIT
jgi:hypothetical protein